MDAEFNSPLGEKLALKEIVKRIVSFMAEAPERKYKITIGTDSELLKNKTADFVTAVVVHRVGNGGRYFWRRAAPTGKFHTLRDRIIKEVLISLEAAQLLFKALKEEVKKEPGALWNFEVHADVGDVGPTKVMIQEVTGMVRAYNFEVRVKPESYAASHVADRHV